MNSRIEEFYNNLIYNESGKEKIELYLNSKGVEKHIILKEKLLNWIEGDKIEYSLIASTYRYDKRLRNILFKYISYLEEFYRAKILDRFRFAVNKTSWVKEIDERLKEYDNDLNDALEHIDFSVLLIQTSKLQYEGKLKNVFPKMKHLKENLIALKELRNAVMHNKFLILYRGFDICYINGVDGEGSATLKANITNLIRFLPVDVAWKSTEEINDASNKKKNQEGTEWKLLPATIIEL